MTGVWWLAAPQACRLNEVNTGGLSSYSLTNMVIAHLQEELKVRAVEGWLWAGITGFCRVGRGWRRGLVNGGRYGLQNERGLGPACGRPRTEV
jgi:hypothetical protein